MVSESPNSIFAPTGPSGSLDSSFGGGDGKVEVPNPAGGGDFDDRTNGMAIDSEGRILVVGTSMVSGLQWAFICRLTANGSLDTGYGGGGCSSTSETAATGYFDSANSVAVDSFGRAVVAGGSRHSDFVSGEWMAVWQYQPDGDLNTGFGTGGAYVTTSTAPGSIGRDGAASVTLDGADNIFVSGASRGGSGIYMALWALDETGVPFGSFPVVDLPGGSGQHSGQIAMRHSSGNILLSGFSTPGTDARQALWNFAVDGTLEGGTPAVSTGGFSVAGGGPLAEGPAGTVVVAGGTTNTGPEPDETYLALWRYHPQTGAAATLDFSFAGGVGLNYFGHPVSGFYSDVPGAMAIDSQGRIVVVANSSRVVPGPIAEQAVVIWRFLSNGNPDISFGGGLGYIVYPSATGATTNPYDAASALRIDSAGRYVIAGTSRDEGGIYRVFLWRVNP